MSMLLVVESLLWSIIGDSGFVISSVVPSAQALFSFHLLTGKMGTRPSVGVKRQWCSHRGKVDNCQVGVFMGYVSHHDHAVLDFRLSLPREWTRDEQRRQACHVPTDVRYQTRQAQCLAMLDA